MARCAMASARLRDFVAQDAHRRDPIDHRQLGDLLQLIAATGDPDGEEFLDHMAHRAHFFIRVTLAAKLRVS